MGSKMKKRAAGILLLFLMSFSASALTYTRGELVEVLKDLLPQVTDLKGSDCKGPVAVRFLNIDYNTTGISISIEAYSALENGGVARFDLDTKYDLSKVIVDYEVRRDEIMIALKNENTDLTTRSAESGNYRLRLTKDGDYTTINILNYDNSFGWKSNKAEQECSFLF